MPLPEYHQLVNEAKKEIKEIDADELKRMQQAGSDFKLIDVREPDEVAQGVRGWHCQRQCIPVHRPRERSDRAVLHARPLLQPGGRQVYQRRPDGLCRR